MNQIASRTLEEACTFGDEAQLTGVYTPADTMPRDTPCTLYITAGLLHHIGPTRLHVDLARALAEDSVAGFRFDLSGAGDSETSALGGYFTERSVSEIKQAMNYLQTRHGHTQFVLAGLCSGADDALATAAADSRVAGLLLLNGYSYPAGYFTLFRWLKFYLPRLFMLEKLINRARALYSRKKVVASALNDETALKQLDIDYRYIPPREQTEAVLKQLDNEQLDMMLVYTGSEHESYSYKGQLAAMFPSLGDSPRVTEYYAQLADHTFILQADRQQLIRKVRSWFAQSSFLRHTT